jgi:hypothetical protein
VTLLVTRLHGFRTVLSRIPTGFGPTIWVGELRDDADLPLEPRHEADQVALRVAPELGDLLRALDKVAQRSAGGTNAGKHVSRPAQRLTAPPQGCSRPSTGTWRARRSTPGPHSTADQPEQPRTRQGTDLWTTVNASCTSSNSS